jgi:hypothetical protein
LSEKEFEFIRSVSKVLYPSKVWMLQDSHQTASIAKWIELLDSIPPSREHRVMDVDYDRYGKGEANLAWLDQSIEFTSNDHSALKIAHEFIAELVYIIVRKGFPIGHLKFLLSYNGQSCKFSYTAVPHSDNHKHIISEQSNRVHIIVNARVQTLPDQLRSILVEVVNRLRSKYNIGIEEQLVSFFQPAFPKPTYRFVE